MKRGILILIISLTVVSYGYTQEQAPDEYCTCAVNPFEQKATKKIKDHNQRLDLFSNYINDLVGLEVRHDDTSMAYTEIVLFLEVNNQEVTILRKLFYLPLLKGDTINYADFGAYSLASYNVGNYVFNTVLRRDPGRYKVKLYLSGKNDKHGFHAVLVKEGDYVVQEHANIIDYYRTPHTYWRTKKSKLKYLFK